MKRMLLLGGCMAIVWVVAVVGGQTADLQQPSPTSPPDGAPSVTTPQVVSSAADERVLLERYCFSCHKEEAKALKGQVGDAARKLTLDNLSFDNIQQHAEVWERVVRKLRAGMMPPPGMRRPEPATYQSMITWLENEIDRSAVAHMPPPGLHRLNRTEYATVIRDFLSLEIDPSKYLPSDDSTHGFDNIAGALGISSTLVEAYVSAAAKISRLALGEPEPPTLVVYRTPEDTTQDYHVEGLPFGTRGGLLVKHLFPSEGEYTVTVTPIFGDNMSPAGFGSVPCERIEIVLDGARLELMDWRGGGRAPTTTCADGRKPVIPARISGQSGPEAFFGGRGGTPMRVRFKATAGLHTVGATFLQTNLAPVLDLDKHFLRSTLQTGPTPGYTFFPHIGTIRIEGPYNAAPPSDSASRRKIFICQPTGPADEATCARKILTKLASDAYRRPASPGDVDLLMEFFEFGRKQKDFEEGIEMALARILASPQFIYRIEEQPTTAKADTYRISDVDLASRLSFFLWSTSPDEELLKIATQDKLHETAVLEQQVRRMLQDPRAEALAVNFAGQWLNLRGLQVAGPLPMLYPDFDDPLRQAMRREVELLFDSIVREDRNVVDLLTADYTFVNERLAKHYGIPNVYGSQFRRVTLGPDMDIRRGLLGKGAFLTTTSKPERTSPVTRGKWIMGSILGMPPPDPPADVPPLPARSADTTGNTKEPTMRQKMLDHRVRADCVQCHRLMDPIGFALENFDAIGLWRTHDEGELVDPNGQLFDNTKVDGPAKLREWLVGYSDLFGQVVAEQLLTYGLGRGVEYQDMPLVRAIARDAKGQDNRFSALVLGVVKSKTFQMNMRVQESSAADQGSRQ